MNKNIGIVGLGLIGASMAKALKKHTGHTVWGYDIDELVLKKALKENTIDFELKEEDNLNKCDILLVSLYPSDTESFIKSNILRLKRGTIIIDMCGVKESLCNELSPIALEHGMYFIGGHPMAGVERSGYDNSFADLFKGASMILCKDIHTNTVALKAAELLFLSVGFGSVTITSAKQHDKMIAFTSQLAHIVSSAYIRSETAERQEGFSAGSYQDLTRVARLNEIMWTQLFFMNKDNLIAEVQGIIGRLEGYMKALQNGDEAKMRGLLKDGTEKKEKIG